MTRSTWSPESRTCLDSAFGTLRSAGVKVVLNFAYEDGKDFDKDVEPHTLDGIFAHLSQLAPVVQREGVYAAQLRRHIQSALGVKPERRLAIAFCRKTKLRVASAQLDIIINLAIE